jgi:hypothetical protein
MIACKTKSKLRTVFPESPLSTLDESLDVQWDDFINAKFAEDRQDVQLACRIAHASDGWFCFVLHSEPPDQICDSERRAQPEDRFSLRVG